MTSLASFADREFSAGLEPDNLFLLAPLGLRHEDRDHIGDAAPVVASLDGKGRLARSIDELVDGLVGNTSSGDQVLIMSNGGFGGLHGRLLEALARRN